VNGGAEEVQPWMGAEPGVYEEKTNQLYEEKTNQLYEGKTNQQDIWDAGADEYKEGQAPWEAAAPSPAQSVDPAQELVLQCQHHVAATSSLLSPLD
ncbi:unnamed protein product, partial [Chrysoparadoxa australica]